MKIWLISLIICTTTKIGDSLSSPENSYKILMLLPFGSKSQYNAFLPFTEGLLSRGHKVWMLSALSPQYIHANLTQVQHNFPSQSNVSTNFFEIRSSVLGWSNFFSENMMRLAKRMYQEESVMALYNLKDEFDVVIFCERYSEAAFPFLEGKVTIAFSTAGLTSLYSSFQGNVINPAYKGTIVIDFPKPLTFLSRFYNFLNHLFEPITWPKLLDLHNVEKELQSQFPSMPSILELRKNVSLVLTNSHFSIEHPFPLLPNQVEVGAMHCRPAVFLPMDIQSWLDDAGERGVIYFSLGSIVHGSMLTKYYRNIFIEAFRLIDQKVLWKFEESIEGLPANVLIQNWVSQQDILGHHNVKLFITHAGLFSTQESIYHNTPMLALPVYRDQFRNGYLIENKKFGLTFEWENLDVQTLVGGIREVINNPIYREKVSLASEALRDTPASPIDTAIWWTEYVIRNKGAPHIKSPAINLSNTEYFMLDVIVIMYICLFLIYWLCTKFVYYGRK